MVRQAGFQGVPIMTARLDSFQRSVSAFSAILFTAMVVFTVPHLPFA
jgi:hypothetical protein